MSKAAERRNTVLTLKLQGFGVDDIAQKLQISVNAARRYLKVALDRLGGDDLSREEAKNLEIARLDFYLSKLEVAIGDGSLAAIDRAIRISERRSQMQGLDAPKATMFDINQQVTFSNLSDQELLQRIRSLQARLGLQQAPPPIEMQQIEANVWEEALGL
jgi:hypothetical protein